MRHGISVVLLAACKISIPDPPPLACDPQLTCPAGYACNAEHVCEATSEPGLAPCGTERACPAAQVCNADNLCEPVTCAQAVTAGDEHTCAIRKDHTAWCWGRNQFGQLGDGTGTDRIAPVEIKDLKLVAISAARSHTCALDEGRTVWCWGSNVSGQASGSSMTNGLVHVANVTGATAIATGADHSCARLDAGTVMCWGNNEKGQLGTGSTAESSGAAEPVVNLGDATEIAAGGDTTCAIHGGMVSCWGDNEFGQLGDGTKMPHNLPTSASLLTGLQVRHIAVGDAFLCALTTGGEVYCVGNNDEGQLGDDAAPGPLVKTQLPVAADAIIAGRDFVCAIEASDPLHVRRRLWCWGEAASHQLADGLDRDHASPLVTAYANVAGAAGGGAHLCAVSGSGDVTCSGLDLHGQLGDGHRTSQGTPAPPIPELAGVVSIAAGEAHSCAVLGGRVQCWGTNDGGQLGDGSTQERSRPVLVEGIDTATAVVAGTEHSCALLMNTTAMCWGFNRSAQLGTGPVDNTDHFPGSIPRPVMENATSALRNIAQIAAGGLHTCALLLDGRVMCWGENDQGQVGNGQRGNPVATPVAVPLMSAAKEIAVGGGHTCAILMANGSVTCWGFNSNGQLGVGMDGAMLPFSTAPVVVHGQNNMGTLSNVKHISANANFTCAITNGGTVLCWGQGNHNQLGNGAAGDSSVPVMVTAVGATATTGVATGGEHACVFTDTELKCWGSNESGQVGDDLYSSDAVPVAISVDGAKITSVAGGALHTCMLLDNQTVRCWGDDARGQLGDGSFDKATRVTPVLPCP
jgi:alpha-tubulin suppressor-like RCC1 family protein